MLPAALLRRTGLRRLVLQARAYAEAAAAPAPAAQPGQMSFTFASPTQVRIHSPQGLQVPNLTHVGSPLLGLKFYPHGGRMDPLPRLRPLTGSPRPQACIH